MTLKDEIALINRQTQQVKDVREFMNDAEPEYPTEEEWKFDHLKDIYELTNDILGKGDAMESTVRLADRCGLGVEFRRHLSELEKK